MPPFNVPHPSRHARCREHQTRAYNADAGPKDRIVNSIQTKLSAHAFSVQRKCVLHWDHLLGSGTGYLLVRQFRSTCLALHHASKGSLTWPERPFAQGRFTAPVFYCHCIHAINNTICIRRRNQQAKNADSQLSAVYNPGKGSPGLLKAKIHIPQNLSWSILRKNTIYYLQRNSLKISVKTQCLW